MSAPFDPALHPHGWHGEFSPTGGHQRSLGRSLQSVNENHPPGGFQTVLSMAYGGVMGAAGNVSATISYDAPPTLPSHIVHVAGWVGVTGGENHWLQVGIAFLPSGQARLYAESRDAHGRYDFRDLGAATARTGYRMAVEKAGKVWVASVNGRRVGAVRVPGADTSAVSAEVASSTYQPTGATYRMRFRDVKAPGAGKPAGKPGATVTAVKGGFDAYSAPATVGKSDTRSLVSVRYPVLVRKQDTTASGIAVRAADTGRVLMLQRSIADEADPARGKWEFPGGKLEDGEGPFDGAAREWQEETGVPLPAGAQTGSWQSGPYVGHVYVVANESDVPLNVDANNRLIGNPDDPDGDDCETLAWWPPSDAEGMPGLRDEVAAGTDWQKIKQAVPGAVFKRDTPAVATIRKRDYPVLVRTAKEWHYDPGQPRDNHGEWTGNGDVDQVSEDGTIDHVLPNGVSRELAERALSMYDMRRRGGYKNQIIAERDNVKRVTGMGVRELRQWLSSHPHSGTTSDPLANEAAKMTDGEIRDAIASIRGTSKRGRRRMMTEAETRALSALYAEQGKRGTVQKDGRYPSLLKEQPSVSDVHVDTASDAVSVAPVKGKKRKKPETIDEPELAVKVVKADAAKQLVYGIVLEPHRVDSQGDWEDHGDIEDACHRYLGQVFKEGVTDLVNLQHRWQAPAGVYPVENYIAPCDFEMGADPETGEPNVVYKGSWVLNVKVEDPTVWQQVLDGEWGGLSVEGTGVRDYDRPAPVAKAVPDFEKALGARLIG